MGNIISDNSVIKKCLDVLNVVQYRCPFRDHGFKKLLTGQAVTLLIKAQLEKKESLESVAEELQADEDLQQFIELDSIHASTIYRKLENFPTDYLKKLYQELIEKIGAKYANKQGVPNIGILNIIDSSEISLPARSKLAYCSKDKNGVKVHTRLAILDETIRLADKIVTSTAAVSDQEATEFLVLKNLATYVFDRGYINYNLYYDWDLNDIPFVARVKANSKLTIIHEQPVEENTLIVRDAKVEVRVPKTDKVFHLRLVEYQDDQKRKYRVVSNRWDLKASDIAEIYRLRWEIESFFKWIKQHLKVVKWFNTKPDAVWNQIYIIMIAYALCAWVKILTGTSKTLWQVLKKLRLHWFKSWQTFLDALDPKPKRTSKGRRKKGKPGRPRKYPKKYQAQKIINP
ncbi:IS4 family transposase [Evansella sp. AB-rgal1]|uniref:IS4 family transposase n=1 Tax=Evansella sp. AB-rgal1 TaxID=3242696 RepID=UPI00359E5385